MGQMTGVVFSVPAGTFLLLLCLVQEAIQFNECFQLSSW